MPHTQLVPLALLLSACGGNKSLPAEPPEVADLVAQEATLPVIAGHADSPTPWPDDSIDGIHGWFALATGDAAPWGTVRASQPTLILSPAWQVPDGTTLVALQPGGTVPVIVQAQETANYGCDGGRDLPGVTPLSGAVTPGMVWVVSPTFQNAKGLSIETSDQDVQRTWSFGDHVVGLSQLDTHRVALWHSTPEQVIQTYDVSKNLMDGMDPAPADLKAAFLLPQANAAWQIGEQTVLGMYWRSAEGFHFEALVLGEAPKLVEITYLYACAF